MSADLSTPTSMGQDSDEDLPATQPVSTIILHAVTAYVEVRSNGESRSSGVKYQLKKLGATIAEDLTRHVTHVVFKEGRLSTYRKAVARKVYLVSPVWVDHCKNSATRVPEVLYPAPDLERYKFPDNHSKIKRMKRYQGDVQEEKEKRIKRRQKKMQTVLAENVNVIRAPPEASCLREDARRRMHDGRFPNENEYVRELRAIVGYIDPVYDDYVNRPESPGSSDGDGEPTPLAVRLLRQFIQTPPSASSVPHSNERKLHTSSSVTPSNERQLHISSRVTANEQQLHTSSSVTPSLTQQMDTDSVSKPSDVQTVGESPVTDVSDRLANFVLSSPTSQQLHTPNNPTRRKSLRQHLLSSRTRPVNSEVSKRTDELHLDVCSQGDRNNLDSTIKSSGTSTQKKRRLYTVTQAHEFPKLIPILEDDVLSEARTELFPSQMSQAPTKSAVDMELTACVATSGIIRVNSASAMSWPGEESAVEEEQPAVSRRFSSRRSSMHFKKPKVGPDGLNVKRLPTIVCTSLLKDEVEQMASYVSSLGGYEMEEKVSELTTHVVTSIPVRRTLNLLKGVARGCWIVGHSWVQESTRVGKWLDEEKYEAVSFSSAVQQCRIEKLSFGPAYQLRIMSACGPIYVSRNSTPSCKELAELITLCGGHVVSRAGAASIVVGQITRDATVTCVSEKWVLDSVTDAEMKPTQDYVIVRGTNRTL